MSGLTLYHSPYSPFSRSVLLLCRYLKLDVNVKTLDLLNDEQMSPEFVKINPQHCVPTIEDEGFYLWESRAILTYLIESRAPHLMPTSPQEKAVMNQRLQFEQGKLATKYAELFVSVDLECHRMFQYLMLFSVHSSKAAQKSNNKQSANFMRFSTSSMSIISRTTTSGLPART
jgi:glutathione S-transferase